MIIHIDILFTLTYEKLIRHNDMKIFATIHLPEHNDAADLENMYSFLA